MDIVIFVRIGQIRGHLWILELEKLGEIYGYWNYHRNLGGIYGYWYVMDMVQVFSCQYESWLIFHWCSWLICCIFLFEFEKNYNCVTIIRMHCRWSCHFNLGLVVCLPTPVITGGKYSRESFGDHSYICRYYHNLVLDSFLIMFGHLVWALLSTALVFTLLGMVGVITLIKFFLEKHLKDQSW